MAEFIRAEDCQGNAHTYWRASRTSSRGDIVLGCGATDSEAEVAVDVRLKELESFLALDPKSQLKILYDKPDMSHRDLEHAVRLLIRVVGVRG